MNIFQNVLPISLVRFIIWSRREITSSIVEDTDFNSSSALSTEDVSTFWEFNSLTFERIASIIFLLFSSFPTFPIDDNSILRYLLYSEASLSIFAFFLKVPSNLIEFSINLDTFCHCVSISVTLLTPDALARVDSIFCNAFNIDCNSVNWPRLFEISSANLSNPLKLKSFESAEFNNSLTSVSLSASSLTSFFDSVIWPVISIFLPESEERSVSDIFLNSSSLKSKCNFIGEDSNIFWILLIVSLE